MRVHSRPAVLIATVMTAFTGACTSGSEDPHDQEPTPDVTSAVPSPTQQAQWEDSIPTITLSSPPNALPVALTPGELDVVVTDDRAYFLLVTESETLGLVFTPGVIALPGEPVRLAHADGRVIASVGDQVEIGGGSYPLGREYWHGGPHVDEYYLAAVEDEGF